LDVSQNDKFQFFLAESFSRSPLLNSVEATESGTTSRELALDEEAGSGYGLACYSSGMGCQYSWSLELVFHPEF
jgi:hypothetical protein